MQIGQRHPGYGLVFFPALQQDATQLVSGSGASSFGFTDAGTALLVFQGTGASSVKVKITDAGAGLETFLSSGASAVRFTDSGAGSVRLDITGSGASFVKLTDAGTGTAGAEAVGGGGFSFDWDRFAKRNRQREERAAQKRRPRRKAQQEIFSYVSESALFIAGGGRGEIATVASGGARLALRGAGRGRMEESPVKIIALLLMSEEL